MCGSLPATLVLIPTEGSGISFLLQDQATALMIASQDGHTETVKCLLNAKAQVDIQKEVRIGMLTWVNADKFINLNLISFI